MNGMNQTPSGERIHIAFFGRRNVGKSSLMNAFTGQELSVVSATAGTTTDAVYKAMELLPLGPVVLIDTPGLDDTGELGEKRIGKALQVMRKADIAIVVADGTAALGEAERELIAEFERRQIPWLLVYNKEDLAERFPEDDKKDIPKELSKDDKFDFAEKLSRDNKADIPEKHPKDDKADLAKRLSQNDKADLSERFQEDRKEDLSEKGRYAEKVLRVSAKTGFHIHELKERVAALLPKEAEERPLIGDLLSAGDMVVLVVPIDKGAPKGRLILPQQQMIRGILEAGAFSLVCRDAELEEALGKLVSPPKLVITDSQVFDKVNRILPESAPLTSFSILMARYKGDLALLAAGAAAVEQLGDGDKVLICEGCTHHRQCEDIGTVKLPNLIRRYTKVEPDFLFTSGTEFPTDVSSYKMVVHCGGCMLNRREMLYRLNCCREQGIPVTNYGVLIAYLNGILERATRILEPFR